MARKRFTAEQMIRHLRQAEVLSSQGRSVSEIEFEGAKKLYCPSSVLYITASSTYSHYSQIILVPSI